MEKHLPRDVRNIALAGHIGSGKTSLLEAILFAAGAIDRPGRIEDGNTVGDYDPEETQRRHSIHLAMAPCDWAGRELHWIDTPGHPDSAADRAAALRVVDDFLLVTPAQNVGDVAFGMTSAWEEAREAGKAEAVFVSKMDKDNADFPGAIDALRRRFGPHVVPAVLPIGSGPNFSGVVDLVRMVAIGAGGKEGPIPEAMEAEAREWRARLVEVAAEGDDALIERYLEVGDLSEEEVERGIHQDLLSGRIVPVFCGSAIRGIGIEPLLNHLALEFEAPDEAPEAVGADPLTGEPVRRRCDPDEPFSALVFKTIADPFVGKVSLFRVMSGRLRADTVVSNPGRDQTERIGPLFALRGRKQIPLREAVAGDLVGVARLTVTRTGDTLCDPDAQIVFPPIVVPAPTFRVAATARTKADEDRLGAALHRVEEEDPGFAHHRDTETGETILTGQGETHLEIVAGRLARFGAHVDVAQPRIAYRETLTAKVRAQGRHKKQTGGRGQFGDCWITVEPAPAGVDFEFVDRVVGGAVPRQYLPAIERGVREAMARGVLAGYPVTGVRVTVDDGSFHPVDSSEAAFTMAGILGFQAAARDASPAILEPIVEVRVTVPAAITGEVVSDFAGRRGQVVGIEPSIRPGMHTVSAIVPESEMLRYGIDLRAISHGCGTFHVQPSHYAPLPAHLHSRLIANHDRSRAVGNYA